MANVTDAELNAAEERGRAILETGPVAVAARYDHATGRVDIELGNGCIYAFPSALVQDLDKADAIELAEIVVDGMGVNLHWPLLDVDLSVPALVAGLFGTRNWMTRELARAAGRAKSPAKTAAARANGARGGRPRKIA